MEYGSRKKNVNISLDEDTFIKVLDRFPLPMGVFATDGTVVYINKAFLELHNIRDPRFYTL